MKRTPLTLGSILVIFAMSGCGAGAGSETGSGTSADTAGAAIPPELLAIMGNYHGDFQGYRWDGTNIVAAGGWTEDITTSDPVVEPRTVHVTAHDHMTFSSGGAYEKDWVEGFLRTADGSIGERYFDVDGQRVIEHLIASNVYTMSRDVTKEELAHLGFANATCGRQITVKTVADEDGVTTERLTIVTEVEWADESGHSVRGQYVTGNGYHRFTRQP
jgi:hypothetical protein